MVKQVFEAVHFGTSFNPIVEEAAEVEQCERGQEIKKKARQLYDALHHIKPSSYDDAGLYRSLYIEASISKVGIWNMNPILRRPVWSFLFCVWLAECFHIQLLMLLWPSNVLGS